MGCEPVMVPVGHAFAKPILRDIKAVCGGNRELKSITIDPEAVDPDDVEMLQDMIVAAVNEAMRKAEADQSANMAKLTGGLNLGGLF